jgi:hypothetical protein
LPRRTTRKRRRLVKLEIKHETQRLQVNVLRKAIMVEAD